MKNESIPISYGKTELPAISYKDLILVLPYSCHEYEVKCLESNIRILVGDLVITENAIDGCSSELIFAVDEVLHDLRSLWIADIFNSAEHLFEHLFAANPTIIKNIFASDNTVTVKYSNKDWYIRKLSERNKIQF